MDFGRLSPDGKADYILFRNTLRRELRELEIEGKKDDAVRPLVPFSIPERRWRSKQRRRQETLNAAVRWIRRTECQPDTPC